MLELCVSCPGCVAADFTNLQNRFGFTVTLALSTIYDPPLYPDKGVTLNIEVTETQHRAASRIIYHRGERLHRNSKCLKWDIR